MIQNFNPQTNKLKQMAGLSVKMRRLNHFLRGPGMRASSQLRSRSFQPTGPGGQIAEQIGAQYNPLRTRPIQNTKDGGPSILNHSRGSYGQIQQRQ